MTRLTVGWVTFTLTWAAWTAIDDWLLRIGLLGGAIAAIGVIWAKGVVPLVMIGRKFSVGVDALLDLKDWRESVEHRLDEIEKHLHADLTVRHEISGGARGEQGETGPQGPRGFDAF